MKHFHQIFADYHQFYLWDKNAVADAPTDYNEEDIRRRIKAAPHVVMIQPARNVEVPVEVEFFAEAPSLDAASWDRIAEASLELPAPQLSYLNSSPHKRQAARLIDSVTYG